MAELVLNAELGRQLGSSSTRRLRREEKIPGVLYGLGGDPVNVAVAYGELRAALSTDAGLNQLINLDLDGDTQLSIVKELQRHPYRDEVIHVDFLRVDPNQELSVDVPIILEGDPRKVTDENGMVDQTLFSLTVLATPTTIPNEVTVDVSDLEINDSIRVADIALPAGVRTEVDPEEAVAVGTVTRSTMEAIAEEEAAEAAEAAEGEEGSEETSDDAGDSGDDDAGDE
ncbi:MAG: 50S ribosomal protein L25 [Acidimicrobiales bacterium]